MTDSTVGKIVFWGLVTSIIYLWWKILVKVKKTSRIREDTLVSEWVRISGVTFDDRQVKLKQLQPGNKLTIRRANTGKYPNAVGVFDEAGTQLGYIADGIARTISVLLRAGHQAAVVDWELVGGTGPNKPRIGIRIKICMH